MSVVARLLATGSGPARTRARLKEQTRALSRTAARLAADHSHSARLVNVPLPPAVLGGDLLNLLSEPLRALLQVDEPPAAAGEPAAAKRGRVDAPARQRGEGHTLPPASNPGRRAERGLLPVSEQFRQPRAPWALPEGGHSLAARPVNLTGASRERSGSPVQGAAAQSPADGGRAATPAARAAAARPTLLARQVDEYFRSRPDSDPQASSLAVREGSELPAAAAVPRPALPNPVNGAASGRTGNGTGWPALSGQQVAERLQAFVSGTPPSEAGRPAGSPAEGGRVEVNNTFHIQVGSAAERGGPELNELSDQVAEILRQQAIQHGIDVT